MALYCSLYFSILSRYILVNVSYVKYPLSMFSCISTIFSLSIFIMELVACNFIGINAIKIKIIFILHPDLILAY